MVQQLALLDPIFKNLLGNDSNPKTFSECFSLLVEAIETKLSFTAINFSELLEKRVRSRFNPRSIFLREGNSSSLGSFSLLCSKAFNIPQSIDSLPSSFIDEFNERIENLFSDSSELVDALKAYYLAFDVPYQMLQKLIPVIYSLSVTDPFITATLLKDVIESQTADQHYQAVKRLISQGLIVIDGKSPIEFEGLTLAVNPRTLVRAMEGLERCPTIIRSWLREDGVNPS
ncbi:hypothetical protein DI09_13p190 [Mitosporidium daphniae]|uniref:Origin recognition complex subunit 4 C-terminal domain-containing protein n=1 Tax=Mitosporidium daphniae TaxID=1485682 RepID=A0A098VUV8_9MICR|nr:uncharacterized protein DI09_13p190 [Mitosporidium daphniae]KGG52730.1 hypothetical protein DI09_13p190 [Mitosporidium daphniae]|eukprot:XP_013239157.1 uncharacterized protein DI09_13p190 [Mitosporidium daphniae]